MIRSNKLKSHMFFCSRDHVKSGDKSKSFYFNFCDAVSTKLEMIMVYERGSPPIIVTGHNSHMTSKKSYSLFSHGPWLSNSTRWSMTTKLDKMISYGIGPPCTKLHHSCIIHAINPISQVPMDTKLDRVVAYDMEPKLKKSHHS